MQFVYDELSTDRVGISFYSVFAQLNYDFFIYTNNFHRLWSINSADRQCESSANVNCKWIAPEQAMKSNRTKKYQQKLITAM